MSHKRTDYISWDEYFMGVAIMSGMRSKDPNTQVGACIVSQDNKILSMDTMVSQKAAMMMYFHGTETETIRLTINTSILHTVN